MAKLLKLRRGTTSQHSSFTGAEGEVTVDTTKDTLVVHDGSTAAGHPVAAEDMANVSAASIKGRLGTTLTNAEINASAAIAGSKISPNFGAQNIQTTGQLQLAGSAPTILLNDENNENDFEVSNTNGTFKVRDIDAGVDRLTINSGGTAGFSGNLDVGAGVDVTGELNVSSHSYLENVTLTAGTPSLNFIDSGNNPDYMIQNQDGKLIFVDTTTSGNTNRIVINTDGHVDVTGNLDVGAGLDVTGNITCTGTIPASQLTGALPAIDGSNLTGVTSVGGATGVSFNDNVKARFGTSNDLDIYHDGNHSYIIDNGTGDLKLRGSETIKLEDTSSGKPMITCTKNQGTEIYHQGGSAVATAVVRLATTSTGVTITGHAVPASNNTHDLGTTSNRWRNIYTNDLHLSNEGHSNDVDSSWGSWTIQEGESDLFLKNNRSGKKYKFNLTEVS